MENFIQAGKRMSYTNATIAKILSGAGIVIGGKLYVAYGDIEVGADGELAAEGVFELAKGAGAISQGDSLYWDESEAELTKTAEGNVFAGVAWKAADSGDATVIVKLGDVGDVGIAAVVAAASFAAVATGGTPDCSAAAIDTVIGTVQTKINAILTALKNAGLMATS